MGFTMASCSAYITMKGVMMPGVSAGSNHVGANEMCTPQVSWPSGPAALAGPGAPTIRARATRAGTWLVVCALLAPCHRLLREVVQEGAGMPWTSIVVIAFPLRSRTGEEELRRPYCRIAAWTAPHAQRTEFILLAEG